MQYIHSCNEARRKLEELGTWTESTLKLWEDCRNDLNRAPGGLDRDGEELRLINSALENISKGPERGDFRSEDEKVLYRVTAENTFKAVSIFLQALTKATMPSQVDIEKKLFRVVFSPGEGGARVYPVYYMHDEFLETTESVGNFRSSTGSGKTRCAPFFFALKALSDDMTMPFFIMTQPNSATIRDKMSDFAEILGDSVILVDQVSELERMLLGEIARPVVCLFTPHGTVKLLSRCQSRNLDIIGRARFALDEIHERSVDTDVLTALLAEKLNVRSMPLHLLMMSATPDPRVLGIFTKVQQFELPDSQLFPIQDLPVEAPDFRSVDKLARDKTCGIIQDMANGKAEPGHILIFTSGNQRINSIINMLKTSVEGMCGECQRKVAVLKKMENFFTSRQVFLDRIDEILAEDTNDETLYVLPIKYAGFVSRDQQEIGKYPIPGHPNIVKVIVATNSIETSVTIDGLAAVVDCGICNQPSYDKDRGITLIHEMPISVQSQTQRRGRVGRIRKGICVQITIKGHPPVEKRPPSIETDDISTNILALRQIGIYLETIHNLPEPGVPEREMRRYIRELQALNALSTNGEITKMGQRLAAFPNMSPFLASSIITASETTANPDLAEAFGTLVVTLIGTNNLVRDRLSEALQRNFCDDSDLFTLASTIIEVMTTKGSTKQKLQKSGLDPSNGLKVISAVQYTAASRSRELDVRDLWTELKGFYESLDKFAFVGSILDNIEKHKPEWVACRRATYENVVNCLGNPMFVYNRLVKEKDAKGCPTIEIDMRPGGKGLAAPGACLVLQVQERSEGIRGSILHRDITRPETTHPEAVETSLSMLSVFASCMIEAYLGQEGSELLRRFRKTRTNVGSSYGGFLVMPQRWGEKTVMSYAPISSNDTVRQNVSEAIAKVERIMPFVPRSVIVNNDVLKIAVVVSAVGSYGYTSKTFQYSDNSIAYEINKNSIEYLHANLREMSSIESSLTVGVTGEYFTCNTEDDQLGQDTFAPSYSSNNVFQRDSSMVILSEKPIPNGKKLPWVHRSVSCEYSSGDALVHVANMVFRNVVLCQHHHDIVYGLKNYRVDVDNLPQFRDIEESSAPIGRIFDRFAMFCIRCHHLVEQVRFKELVIRGTCDGGPTEKDIKGFVRLSKSDSKLAQHLDTLAARELAQVKSNIRTCMNTKTEAIKRLNATGDGRIKREIAQVNRQLGELNDRKKRLESDLHRFIQSDEDIKTLGNLTYIGPMYKIKHLFLRDGYYEAILPVEDCDEAVSLFRKSGFTPDRVPLVNVTINHLKNQNLTQEEFIQNIDDVCAKFGGIVRQKSEYKQAERKGQVCGSIQVTLYTCEFAIPFAGEIEKAIGSRGRMPFQIQTTIVPPVLRGNKLVGDCIAEWIQANGLELERTGNKFFGTANAVAMANKAMSNPKTKLVIPFKAISVPGGTDPSRLETSIRLKNRKADHSDWWYFQRTQNIVYVPEDVQKDDVYAFFANLSRSKGKANDEILFDYVLMCEETAVLSARQIPLYYEDGSLKLHNFCVTCCYDALKFMVDKFFNAEEDLPILERMHEIVSTDRVEFPGICPEADESSFWPVVPLGQLMWALTSEPLVRSVSRTWFSAIVAQALHNSPLIEVCPQHPSILLRNPGRFAPLKCSERTCQFRRCVDCGQWHQGRCDKQLTVPPGFRTCPGCKRVIEKTEACNHMACKCGKHFCYYCEFGPEDSSDPIYAHMSREGHGAQAPDYQKFCKGRDVSQAELDAFYRKYPKFRPE